MFNIGVEAVPRRDGDGVVGGAHPRFPPGLLHLTAVLLFACIGGMVYAAVPGVLKVKTGAHEVVTTIVMNSIAIEHRRLRAERTAEVHGGTAGRTSTCGPTSSSALMPDLGHFFGVEKSAHLSWLFPWRSSPPCWCGS